MRVLVASDLDQTLIYSARSGRVPPGASPELTCVEVYDGREQSFMLASAVAALADLALRAAVVPVTTRTVEQLERVRVPGMSSRYGIAANGGVLLVDGAPDASWAARVASAVADSAPVTEVRAHLAAVCRPDFTRSVRTA